MLAYLDEKNNEINLKLDNEPDVPDNLVPGRDDADNDGMVKVAFYEYTNEGIGQKVKKLSDCEEKNGNVAFLATFSTNDPRGELECTNETSRKIRIECDSSASEPGVGLNVDPKSRAIIKILNRKQIVELRFSYNDDDDESESMQLVHKIKVKLDRDPVSIQGKSMTLMLEQPNGSIKPVTIGDENTIQDLKYVICDETGCAPDEQILSMKGQPIAESDTAALGKCGITDKTQIKCESKAKGGSFIAGCIVGALVYHFWDTEKVLAFSLEKYKEIRRCLENQGVCSASTPAKQ